MSGEIRYIGMDVHEEAIVIAVCPRFTFGNTYLWTTDAGIRQSVDSGLGACATASCRRPLGRMG